MKFEIWILTFGFIQNLIRKVIFGPNQERARKTIRRTTQKAGIFLSSTQKLYEKIARGECEGFTVPAFNIRTLTFDVARALFRAAKKEKVGPFIIELAQSEIEYTKQTPSEYLTSCLAAAIEEKFKGPLFFQGDHFKPRGDLENLIRKSIRAGFYNLDIDCSALPKEENFIQTAKLTGFIRKLEPKNLTISLGGEVGEIGGENTTVEELERFMQGYKQNLSRLGNFKGLIKLAVQTGTAHGRGGKTDFEVLKALSKKAEEYGLAGVVQHGASTLPDKEFKKFPEADALEIHLATEFQNIILKSPYFPKDLKEKIFSQPVPERKKMLGPLKKEIWNIPQKNIDKICEGLEQKFIFFFRILNISGSRELINEIYH